LHFSFEPPRSSPNSVAPPMSASTHDGRREAAAQGDFFSASQRCRAVRRSSPLRRSRPGSRCSSSRTSACGMVAGASATVAHRSLLTAFSAARTLAGTVPARFTRKSDVDLDRIGGRVRCRGVTSGQAPRSVSGRSPAGSRPELDRTLTVAA
jgi:hypothetical protein